MTDCRGTDTGMRAVDYAPGMNRKALGTLAALALLGALSACSSDDEPATSGAERTPATTDAAPQQTPTAALGMRDACDFIDEKFSTFPDSDEGRDELAGYMARLALSADRATRAALLRIASAAANEAGGEGLDDVVARQAEFDHSLDNMAAECKAVGSSALQ